MKKHITIIRRWLLFFMIALIISGATAIPLEAELALLLQMFPSGTASGWFSKVNEALAHNRIHFPFLNYGYDWLAFAHFILAILFIGPYRDPVRNKWVIEFGIIACVLVLPFAFIAGYYRGISVWWRLIDCCFGLAGLIPLLLVRRRIIKIEKIPKRNAAKADSIAFHRIRISSLTKSPIEHLN